MCKISFSVLVVLVGIPVIQKECVVNVCVVYVVIFQQVLFYIDTVKHSVYLYCEKRYTNKLLPYTVKSCYS